MSLGPGNTFGPISGVHFTRRASSPKAVAISGPMLSIVPPCFGQTGLECGAELCRPSVNPAFMRVTLD